MDVKPIFVGIFNWLFRREKIEERAEKRMSICDTCELKQKDGLGSEYCGECGCFLEWKTRSNSECGFNYWIMGKVSDEHLKDEL